MTTRIAALLACHNRREHTLSCLKAIKAQIGHEAMVDVIALDAGSTDGTSAAIHREFPDVTVLPGSADMYWNAGMRAAFAYATERDYDYYLWLNDDTFLDDDAVARLLDTMRAVAQAADEPAIVVGSTRSPTRGSLTYGGVHRPNPLRPTRFFYVHPGEGPRECETMNGNCVLVPREVVTRIGLLDGAFSHGMGDYDYGLRARRAGCRIWIVPGTVATCARSDEDVPSSAGPLQELRRLRSPTGLPLSEWLVFTRRWAGRLWPLYALTPYLRRLAASVRSSN